jgi:hypothetical protein
MPNVLVEPSRRHGTESPGKFWTKHLGNISWLEDVRAARTDQ